MPDELSNGSSEIAALAQQVETARGKLPLQLDPALLQVLSEREISAERELAEWIRAQRRKQRRLEIEEELAAQRRDRKSAAALRRSEEADARWHRRALAARRRVSSEDARLAQLYRRAEWSSRALIAVVVLGMVWAGVNVQHNLVPSGDMSDPLYWLSYGIEAMISIPIITIMVAATTAARWGRELARGKVILFEAALLGTTVALNTGPHLAAGDLGRAAEYAIAPVMVGVVIWLHAWVSARYAVLIDGAPVIEREPQPVRIDAERIPGLSDRDRLRPLDGVNSAHSAFGWDTAAHRHEDFDPGRGAESDRRISQPDGVHVPRAGLDTAAHRSADTAVVDRSDSPRGKSATTNTPVTSSSDGHTTDSANRGNVNAEPAHSHAVASPANGHAFPHVTNSRRAETTVNGHILPNGHAALPIEGESADGNAAELRLDERRVRPASNGHTVENSTTGAAHDVRTNGHSVRPITNGYTAENSPTGRTHGDESTFRPTTNGYSAESVTDAAHHAQSNGHGSRANTNGHAAGISPGLRGRDLRVNGHTPPLATNGHTGSLTPDESTHSSTANGEDVTAPPADHSTSAVADYVFHLPTHEPTTRAADAPAPTSEADAERGQPSQAGAPSSVDAGGTIADPADTTTQETRPEPTQTSQQISLDDLHDGLELRERRLVPPNREHGTAVAASPHPHVDHGGHPDRAPRGNDPVRHPSAGAAEPGRTPASATTDAATQVHPNATAARAAKRGKSLSGEQNDRSAEPEGEQLALEQSPEPPRPEPLPILDADDDEDGELPAEPEEADTDDDEISAIARAITTRRLSSLPIEEVREILTLADQGGSTPAIANELGVSRAAVTRVLDSAIKVHRPYAVIG
ncbi:hypothetical protein IU486_22305 [Streptomyces gardneri]|nr:hypothetical protein [Streptomyces gardneri]